MAKAASFLRISRLALALGALAACNGIAGILPADEVDCLRVGDCAATEPFCGPSACEDGRCVYTLAGTPLSPQVDGDCSELVCDGRGNARRVHVATDIEDDGNPCTADACVGGSPVHTPITGEVACYTGAPQTRNRGACQDGRLACQEGSALGACEGEIVPKPETCKSIEDEDCDGLMNEEGEACACLPGEIRECYSGQSKTLNVGACHAGHQICEIGGLGFGACIDERTPGVEDCDAAHDDEDCDGATDEDGADCACGDGVLSADIEDCEDGNQVEEDLCPLDCRRVVVGLGAGARHTCAMLKHGFVKCWGSNVAGQLGLGDSLARGDSPGQMGEALPALALGALGKPVAVTAAWSYSCALLEGGSIACWGRNKEGELGLGDDVDRSSAMDTAVIDLGAGRAAIAVDAGKGGFTCALLDDGSVKCWGANSYGSLGLGDSLQRGTFAGEMGDALPAVDLGTGRRAVAMATGSAHTCAILDDGRVKCWGQNETGQLGVGDLVTRGDDPGEMGDALPAVDLGAGRKAVAIAAGSYHTCAILDDDRLKCWGGNYAGELGLGDSLSRGDEPGEMGDALPAVDLGAGKVAVKVTLGEQHSCALLENGEVKCWGSGPHGELGLGVINNRGAAPGEMGAALPPVRLGAGKVVVDMDAGGRHTCARFGDGSVKCWGLNAEGQLGLGDMEDRGYFEPAMGDALPKLSL